MTESALRKGHLDFMVIGAAKSGTTTLFEHLRRHPDVWMPPVKEVPYFCSQEYLARNWHDHLREVFADAPSDRLWGTATPQYMAGTVLSGANHAPESSRELIVPARIHSQLPNLRLVAILRDPVERCVSAYRMSVRRGLEQRSAAEAIEQLLTNEELEQARREPTDQNGHVVIGEYARILEAYYSTFAPEQLLVVFTNELNQNPLGTMRRVFSHISANPEFVPPNIEARYQPVNARAHSPRFDPDRLRAHAGSTLPIVRSLWRRLPATTRERIDRGYGNLVYRSRLWNRNTAMSAADELPPPTRSALVAHYHTELGTLTALLGCAPPWADGHARAIDVEDRSHI
ncbi:MAG: sulfotransferase [Solirubrobacteraceae bacterium]